jgi:aerobic carbon-monoxide dehydrogenase large subunit
MGAALSGRLVNDPLAIQYPARSIHLGAGPAVTGGASMGEFAFGQPVRRKEDPRLLTGRGAFIEDRREPGEAHAVLLRSPHAHARILSIDTAAARSAPGVLGIFTGRDLEADGIGGIPCEFVPPKFGISGIENCRVVRPHFPALALDRARFCGEGVALVVAETIAQAKDAAELIVVDYEPLPATVGTRQARAPDAARVHEAAPGNVAFSWEAGDKAGVDAAFLRAHRVVGVELVNNRVVIGAMETRGALGLYDAGSGRFTLYTATQMPHGIRHDLAKFVFRMPEPQIRVAVGDVGGGFGAKNSLYPEQVLVLYAARKLGRPVRWIGERGEAFLGDYQGRDNVTRGELALDRDGGILALRVNAIANLGAYLAPEGPLSPTLNTSSLAGVYRTPAIHVTVTGVFTHTAPVDVYRGAGRPESIYLLESLINAAARELDLDVVDFRRRNLISPAELPFKTSLDLVYDSGEFERVLDAALARADWADFPQRRAESARRGQLRGIGFVHYVERVAGGWPETSRIELASEGRAIAYLGAMSNGQGHETAFAQLVAARLGLSIDDVEVVEGDTDRVASGHGTGGSASLGIAGAALDAAMTTMLARARQIASELLETAAADIEFDDGRFVVGGTDRAVSLKEIARAAFEARFIPPGGKPGLGENGDYRPPNPTFPNGCHVAEVEIDPETGALAILRYTMVHDFGRMLNPLLVEGQLHGGVAQGLGQAGFEHVVYDPGSGQLLSGSFMDYCLPRAADLPDLDFVERPTPSPTNPLGIKGCGEAGAAGAPPALMNAVLYALAPLGIRHIDMPATPEQLWRAIRDARGR